MKEGEMNKAENVIARSDNGLELVVVNPGEKRELSPEQKAKIPERIKKAEQDSISRKSKSGRSETETIIDEKIKALGLKGAKEDYDSTVNFLNSLN